MNILFLGDSITNCGHCFTPDNLGNGYVKKLSLLPDITATNGGTDGFTFPDVLRKWRLMYAQDTYDCVVITCGINDVSVIADLAASGKHEAAAMFLEDSMAALRALLYETGGKTSLQTSSTDKPQNKTVSPSGTSSQISRILLLEPFLFPIPQARMRWLPVLLEVRDRIQKVISDFNKRYAVHTASVPCARYIPTQAVLNDLARQIGLPAVTADGIHLTDKGHECLAKLVADVLKIFHNQ